MGDVKSLIDGPHIDKHCFVYCGDDACSCSAGPNWHSPPVASPPASVEEIERLLSWLGPANKKIVEALLSDRAAMAERVERLERERDEARFERDHFRALWEAERAEVARLREALEDAIDELADAYRAMWLGSGGGEYEEPSTIATFRAALTRPDEPTKET